MRIGSHVSIKEGYLGAAQIARSIGADAFQFFSKNPRSLTVKEADPMDMAACKTYTKTNNMSSIIHSPYPVNIAVSEPKLQDAVVHSVRNDLEIADGCGAIGVVVHFGHYKGTDTLQGYKNILQCIHRILAGYSGDAVLLIENQAGGNPPMGTTIEELMQIRELCSMPEKVAFCFDTCHAFSADMFQIGSLDTFINKAHNSGYFKYVKAIHLNDSQYRAGSGKDRHANIGRGKMGSELLKCIVKSFHKQPIPVILETPKTEQFAHDSEIQLIRQWVSGMGGEEQ